MNELMGAGFRLRPWCVGDAAALVAHADDARVSAGLSDRFPFPCANNPASARVLGKSGFVLEGVQRRAAIKRGGVLDVLMHARLRGNRAPSPSGPSS